MLTMFIKAYCVNVAVNIKPIFLKQTGAFACLFTTIKESYNFLLRTKCSLKLRFKKFWIVKSLIFQWRAVLNSMLKHGDIMVRIVKIYMVNFNAATFSRLNIN